MTSISLYMAPGTCARGPCVALEEAGVDFETVVVRFKTGEHKSLEAEGLTFTPPPLP